MSTGSSSAGPVRRRLSTGRMGTPPHDGRCLGSGWPPQHWLVQHTSCAAPPPPFACGTSPPTSRTAPQPLSAHPPTRSCGKSHSGGLGVFTGSTPWHTGPCQETPGSLAAHSSGTGAGWDVLRTASITAECSSRLCAPRSSWRIIGRPVTPTPKQRSNNAPRAGTNADGRVCPRRRRHRGGGRRGGERWRPPWRRRLGARRSSSQQRQQLPVPIDRPARQAQEILGQFWPQAIQPYNPAPQQESAGTKLQAPIKIRSDAACSSMHALAAGCCVQIICRVHWPHAAGVP